MSTLALKNMTSIYFPGDCPIVDVLLLLSLFILFIWVITILASIAKPIFKKQKLSPNKMLLFTGLITIIFVVVFVSIIGARNFGEWKELKQQLIFQSNRVEKIVPEKGRMLTYDEYQRIKEKLFKEPVIFQSKSLKNPIEIRMMQTIPPYVGVDFGKGRNAVFNLSTMLVTYSD